MDAVPKQRKIINRRALMMALEEVTADGYSSKNRPDVLKLFKEAYDGGMEELRRRLEKEGTWGEEYVRGRSFLLDQIIRTLHEFVTWKVFRVSNPTTSEHVCIVALGGYGREELCPYSDIDLLFLLPYKQTAHIEQVVEYILYLLWDLGLKVGHATRTVDECIRMSKDDVTIQTSMLDARYISGLQSLYNEFQNAYETQIMEKFGTQFVEAKLKERDERIDKMGDSRYVVEPNLKEGKGGLRDLQTLWWIARFLYQVGEVDELVQKGVFTEEDAKRFEDARSFLFTVRCYLHILAGRPEERLTFDVQPQLADLLHYTDHAGTTGVERFMKHYYLVAKDVGDLTRILCAVLEEQQKKKRINLWKFAKKAKTIEGFRLEGDRLMAESPDAFEKDPIKLLTLFEVAQENRIDIHPQALRLVHDNLRLIDEDFRNDPEANEVFMNILTSKKDPEDGLKRMNEAGVFGRFVPDFGRVVAQMQYDMYHVYTVDEHTIRAIGMLSKLEKGELQGDYPVTTDIIKKINSRRALYVAVLLHDIAKGRGGDHSEIGADIARKLGPRFGLTDEETETVSWLVLHHLAMSYAAFNRDISDPQTVRDFVELVQSPERLHLLVVLTVADICAVGPGVWTGWKSALLRELYLLSEDALSGGMAAQPRDKRVATIKQELREALASSSWSDEEIEAHLDKGYPHYWLSYDVKTLAKQAEMIKKAERDDEQFCLSVRNDDFREVSEITVYVADHPGVFSQIAGAVALTGLSIVDAKIATLSNGMALDTFSVFDEETGSYPEPIRIDRLRGRIEDAISGRTHINRELIKQDKNRMPSRTEVFTVPPRVIIDNEASGSHTVIEVNGRDRPGFLYRVTRALSDLGLQIHSAQISTFGERVVDVFYVKDVFGLKISHDTKIKQIRESLLEAIQESQPDQDQSATTAAE